MLHPPGSLLLLDDFDEPACAPEPAPEPEIILPTHPEEDLRAARAEGFEDGYRQGMAEAEAARGAEVAATLRAIAASLEDASRCASEAAEASVHAMLKLLVEIIVVGYPTLRARYGQQEIRRLADVVLPAMAGEPNVVAHVNPSMLDAITAELAAFPGVAVVPAASIPPGDVRITWKDGFAERNTGAAWAATLEILGPLGLVPEPAPAASAANT